MTERKLGGLERLLLRPFDTLSTRQALAIGVTAIIATALLASSTGLQTRGVVDLQFLPGAGLAQLLMQGLINWLSLGLALLVVGRWLATDAFSSARLLANQAAARAPLLLSAAYLSIPPLGGQIRELTQRLVQAMPSERGQVMADAAYMGDAFILTLLGVPLLVFLIWTVWLMYHAYQSATGLSGPRAAFSFAGGLLAAYIISRAVIALLL